MLKTSSQLNADIDSAITTNGTGDITGSVMNTLLKSMVGSFAGGTFSFTKDAGVTTADIGKLMMNDGSGTAKVYQLSPATSDEAGKFIIRISDLGDTNDESTIAISSQDHSMTFNRVDWRDGGTPSTTTEEMEMIQDYIEANSDFSYLTVTFDTDHLVLEEASYNRTIIKVSDFNTTDVFIIDNISRPALPAAPTAFPLGKLVAIDGENAIISSNAVETYALDGTCTIDQDYFNNATEIDYLDGGSIGNIFTLVAVPSSDGLVKPFNPEDINFDGMFSESIRQHFVGIPIAATTNTITVLHTTNLSFLLAVFLRLVNKAVVTI